MQIRLDEDADRMLGIPVSKKHSFYLLRPLIGDIPTCPNGRMGADAIKQETHVATAVPGVGELASAREAAKNAQRPMQENRIAHEDNLVRATEVKARIVSNIVYHRFLCARISVHVHRKYPV